MGKIRMGLGFHYIWNECPIYCLPEVGRCLGKVSSGVNIFRPVMALVVHKYDTYFYRA